VAKPRALPSALALPALTGAAAAQECLAAPGHDSFTATGIVLADGRESVLSLPPGWTLTFEPAPAGWSIRIRDRGGLDLSALTSPRFGPDPRDLFGWHFRNAANSGPNAGDVNAPQLVRDIRFEPGLAGTAGIKPSDGSLGPVGAAGAGAGWFRLSDLVLTPPEPGRQAALLGVRVDACLTWRRDSVAPDPLAEWREQMGACGLDPDAWEPRATLLPALLAGDVDGDGSLDIVAMLDDRASGRAAVAVCRAGTRLTLIGEDDPAIPAGLLPRVEAWRLLPRDHGPTGYVGEPPWPQADGDVIALERIEKSLDLLFMAGGAWRGLRIFRLVTDEP